MCRWEMHLQGFLACQVINVMSQGLLQLFIAVARGCHCKTYKGNVKVVAFSDPILTRYTSSR